ncbi:MULTISPECIES: hypothetical protein [unclassified Wolbachia]|uniref:hypothetical protein n=1 Tax=unclassified Wolbachia TaxID=2640676 RepID=UPI0021F84E2A|nr:MULTISPECIES: hypothetical protein [unclassified Wolbachia]
MKEYQNEKKSQEKKKLDFVLSRPSQLQHTRKPSHYNAPHKLDQKKMVDPSRKVKG